MSDVDFWSSYFVVSRVVSRVCGLGVCVPCLCVGLVSPRPRLDGCWCHSKLPCGEWDLHVGSEPEPFGAGVFGAASLRRFRFRFVRPSPGLSSFGVWATLVAFRGQSGMVRQIQEPRCVV